MITIRIIQCHRFGDETLARRINQQAKSVIGIKKACAANL